MSKKVLGNAGHIQLHNFISVDTEMGLQIMQSISDRIPVYSSSSST